MGSPALIGWVGDWGFDEAVDVAKAGGSGALVLPLPSPCCGALVPVLPPGEAVGLGEKAGGNGSPGPGTALVDAAVPAPAPAAVYAFRGDTTPDLSPWPAAIPDTPARGAGPNRPPFNTLSFRFSRSRTSIRVRLAMSSASPAGELGMDERCRRIFRSFEENRVVDACEVFS